MFLSFFSFSFNELSIQLTEYATPVLFLISEHFAWFSPVLGMP